MTAAQHQRYSQLLDGADTIESFQAVAEGGVVPLLPGKRLAGALPKCLFEAFQGNPLMGLGFQHGRHEFGHFIIGLFGRSIHRDRTDGLRITHGCKLKLK